MKTPTPVLDAIDEQLVALLQGDCKQSLTKLGSKVGLSGPAVHERVRKLEQAGVIQGYHAVVDSRRLGLDITAFIGVSITFPKDIDSFLGEVAGQPEVLECHHVTGAHTLLLKVKTSHTASLERLISGLRGIAGVERTETMVVLSTASESLRVTVPSAAGAPRRARRAS